MFSNSRLILLGVAAAALTSSSLHADFLTWSQPTSAYTSSTTLLDFPDPDFTTISSLSGSGETLSYSTPLEELTAPITWTYWNSPPATETANARVGFTSGASSLTISLSAPASTFGLEIGPDNFLVERTTAAYYDGSTLVGTIDLSPDGNAGALLFAASTTTSAFTKVVITNTTGDDFSIARQRFAISSGPPPPPPTVPEPSTFVLSGSALLVAYRVVRKRSA